MLKGYATLDLFSSASEVFLIFTTQIYSLFNNALKMHYCKGIVKDRHG